MLHRASAHDRGSETAGDGSISIVLPAFNEAPNIQRSVEAFSSFCRGHALDYEIIVVDDGSEDATGQLGSRMADASKRVRLLQHSRNKGYGAALRTGILAATKEMVFFTDADLQFDAGELERLLRFAHRFDIVMGYRAARADPLHRRLNAWAWGRLMSLVFDLRVRDIDCAFKLFHRRVFESIAIQSVGAFVSTEILVRARTRGFSIHEVPVSHYPRQAGTQTGAHPRVVFRAFMEVVRLHGVLKRDGEERRDQSVPSPAGGTSPGRQAG